MIKKIENYENCENYEKCEKLCLREILYNLLVPYYIK